MDSLEQTGAIRIILFLQKKGPATLTDIKNGVNCSLSAIYNALQKLENEGLIKKEFEKTFPRRRVTSLTDKGKEVAKKLEEIEFTLKHI